MSTRASNDDDLVSLPLLLRAARGAYGHAIRAQLAADGMDDMPRNGPFVLSGMANHSFALGDLIPQLGISKQATSQLIDVLVTRGYLARQRDPADRRRVSIELTGRGHAAAAAIRAGISEIDSELATRVSPAVVRGLRTGLVALYGIREDLERSA